MCLATEKSDYLGNKNLPVFAYYIISCFINTIFVLRHLDLTEEEREKLDGSYKVAKKLEKLQSKRQDQQQNSLGGTSDDANDGNESPTADGESRSLDSQGSSEKTSPETSLIGSNGM